MSILVLGLVLFLGVHSVRMIAPAGRDAMIPRLGDGPYKGLYSLVSAIGFVLIVWGFARASSDTGTLYVPPFWLRHVTETAVLVALILAVASNFPGSRIRRWVRNPLLIATILWAIAHLFVNGDTAGVVLFGAFLAWAILDLWSSSQRPRPVNLPPPSTTADIIAVVAGAALYGLLVWRLHFWLFGVSPIG